MFRLWFFLSMFLVFAQADDTILLNTHIKMIPKIMVLDQKMASKSNTAILAIAYEPNRKALAQKIADEINQSYNGKVGNLNFIAMAINVDDLLSRKDISFIYLTSMSNRSVDKIAAWSLLGSIPTFSYDLADLERGILGSIVIERSTVIYINKNALKEGKFRFNDTLFQLARMI
jgi:hypothetical protein